MRMATVGAGEYKLNSSIDHIIMNQDATGQLQCEWIVSGCGRRTEFRSRAMWSEATATMMAQRTTLLPPRCVFNLGNLAFVVCSVWSMATPTASRMAQCD
eukprot:COSAG06_NODE_1813_length_8305_cov_5.110407_9_plen_100_part_00